MNTSFIQIIGTLFFCLVSFWNLFIWLVTFGNRKSVTFFLLRECKFFFRLFSSNISVLRDEEGLTKGISKPLLIISNHQSLLDILVMYALFPFPLSFIAKKELFKVPFLNFHLIATGGLSIDRNSPRKAYRDMEHAAKVLKKRSLLVFPEGTRQTNDAIGSFKRGFIKLALDAGCDVIPVVTRGTATIIQKKSLKVDSGKTVKVIIGKRLTLEDIRQENSMERIHDWFLKNYEELKKE